MKYALMQSGTVQELFETQPDFHPDLMKNILPVADDVQVGMVPQTGGGYAFPPSPKPNYRALAQAALDKSDVTVLRCASAGVAVPAAWQAYRVALRAIVGNGAGPLPERPAYPTGT